jgi:hypothetical protein
MRFPGVSRPSNVDFKLPKCWKTDLDLGAFFVVWWWSLKVNDKWWAGFQFHIHICATWFIETAEIVPKGAPWFAETAKKLVNVHRGSQKPRVLFTKFHIFEGQNWILGGYKRFLGGRKRNFPTTYQQRFDKLQTACCLFRSPPSSQIYQNAHKIKFLFLDKNTWRSLLAFNDATTSSIFLFFVGKGRSRKKSKIEQACWAFSV